MPPWIAAGADEVTLCTTDLLLEGVDFDLTYFPLKHLGYKAVVVAVSDLLAMNGRPEQLLVSLGVSSKISVEALDDLYAGIRFACEEMEVDLVGGRYEGFGDRAGYSRDGARTGPQGGGGLSRRRQASRPDLYYGQPGGQPTWDCNCSNARSGCCGG